MTFIIALIGTLFFAIGFLVLLNPSKFKWFLTTLTSRRIYAASLFRILIGIVFLYSAPETRAPLFIRLLGVLFILGGLLAPALGHARSEAIAAWWVKRSDTALRLWGLLTMLLGGAVFFTVMR